MLLKKQEKYNKTEKQILYSHKEKDRLSMFDYLDSKGQNLNWITQLPFSEEYKREAATWKNFPVYQNEKELRKLVDALLDKNIRLIVAKAGTGTGKTVIIPKLALKSQIETRTFSQDWRVAMTIPKSLSTKGAGEFAAKTLDVPLGKEVGYIYRDSDEWGYNKVKARLTYMTDGYLLATSLSDPLFSIYSVIIIDEAHERSKNIDLLLYKLKNAMRIRGSDLKVIIISATIDPQIFVDYFCDDDPLSLLSQSKQSKKSKQSKQSKQSKCAQVVVFSPKTSYPIEEIHLEGSQATIVNAVNLALKNSMDEGDVALTFVPTSKETEKGCKDLNKACQSGLLNKRCLTLSCAPLYSKLSDEDQKKATGDLRDDDGHIYDPMLLDPYKFKIVFSTNIAESSLTINNLKVVIDTGLEFENKWDPLTHSAFMGKVKCTKAQILQRKGRVGRKSPGTVYYLYSKKDLEQREEYPAPNLHKADLTEDILKIMKSSKSLTDTLNELAQFLTPPTQDQIAGAFYNMHVFNLIHLSSSLTINTSLGFREYRDTFQEVLSRIHYHQANQTKENGYLNILGHFVLNFVQKLRIELWYALLLAPAYILTDGNIYPIMQKLDIDPFEKKGIKEEVDEKVEKERKEIEDVILLVCILNYFSKFPGSIFDNILTLSFNPKIKDKIDDLKHFLIRKTHYDFNKEHASLVRLFRYLFDYIKINDNNFIKKETIENVYKSFMEMKDLLKKMVSLTEKSLQVWRPKIRATSFLLQNLYQTRSMSLLDKCVFYSRIIHLSEPQKCRRSSSQNKNDFDKVSTLLTLRPLTSKLTEPRQDLEKHLIVYENATVMKKESTNSQESSIRIVSSFPKNTTISKILLKPKLLL